MKRGSRSSPGKLVKNVYNNFNIVPQATIVHVVNEPKLAFKASKFSTIYPDLGNPEVNILYERQIWKHCIITKSYI